MLLFFPHNASINSFTAICLDYSYYHYSSIEALCLTPTSCQKICSSIKSYYGDDKLKIHHKKKTFSRRSAWYVFTIITISFSRGSMSEGNIRTCQRLLLCHVSVICEAEKHTIRLYCQWTWIRSYLRSRFKILLKATSLYLESSSI